MNNTPKVPCDNCGNSKSAKVKISDCTGKIIFLNICSDACIQSLMILRACSARPDEQGYF